MNFNQAQTGYLKCWSNDRLFLKINAIRITKYEIFVIPVFDIQKLEQQNKCFEDDELCLLH